MARWRGVSGIAGLWRRLASPGTKSTAEQTDKDRFTAPHGRPSLQASIVAAVVAVGLVLALVAITSKSTQTNGALPTTSLPAPSTTSSAPVPSTQATVPAPPARSTTTTTARTVTRVTTTTTTVIIPVCSASDFEITTSTDQSTYAPASTVTVTTTLRDLLACVYQPVDSPPYSCSVTLTVDEGGAQVFPAAGQTETCNDPGRGVIEPGTQIMRSIAWSDPPPGTYEALAAWDWAGSSGTVNQSASSAFTVS
ncbi:MAG: hypothetical protein ACYDD4_12810 [Acidimicrobiales bacterium]